MNRENISNAMNSIDDDMLRDAALRRYKSNSTSGVRRIIPKVAAAVLAICIIGGMSVYAITNGGYFKDRTNLAGTVIGQTYENATDETTVGIVNQSEIYISFQNYDKPPYTLPGTNADIYLNGYRITDESGEAVLKMSDRQKLDIIDGTAMLVFDSSSLSDGTYTFTVDGFTVESKGDQPLMINGNWSTEFVVR